MRRWWSVLGLFLFVMLFSAQTTQQEQKPQYVEGEVVVKLKNVTQGGILAQSLNLTMDPVMPQQNIFVLKDTTGKDAQELATQIAADTNVAYAEPNFIYHTMGVPNDPQFGQLWGMNNTGQSGGTSDADVDAVEAWEVQTGSSDVLVAIIDTGVDYKHPDLQANMWTNPNEDAWSNPNDPTSGNHLDDDGNGFVDDWRGWDFVNNDNDPFDDNAHGTHVAGTIGAVGDNNVGVAGVNWEVSIMPLKFLSANGSGSLSDAVAAIDYAVSFGAHVMNNSWGGGGFSQALRDAIASANNAGSLFVAAAGNEGNNNDVTPNYPSNYDVPNVLAVAAIDRQGVLAVFGSGGGGGGTCGCNGNGGLPVPGSNFGATTVDLAAPGKEILSTTPNNGYQTFSGTSMATPHVAGIAALTLAQFQSLTVLQLKQRLLGSVDLAPSLNGRTVTGGILNAQKAVSGPAL